jgi:hypothetical protein
MGYLDNSTIVVDAVLTKHGRKLLAKGEGLNIKYFTLSDTGIDYSLWNPDHPSGSAYYGEAIENLPSLEALPSSTYFMRNNLITMNRDDLTLPYVKLDNKGIGVSLNLTFDPVADHSLVFGVELSPDETTGWQCVVSDDSLISITSNWTRSTISGNAASYLNDVEIANAAVYESNDIGNTMINIVRTSTTTERSLTLTFISRSTGAYKHATLTLPAIVD